MPCENLRWGFWADRTFKGKFQRLNYNPLKKRGKLYLDGDWISKKVCRKWTKKEINQGYGYSKKYGKVKLVPITCGHCDQCRLNHANEWVTRILCEYQTSGKIGCKIDLTYNKENIPNGYVLSIADYQNWIKRLRMHLKRHDETYKGFKYYIGGEYGPTTGRPHYHIIIIGWEPTDQEFWKKSKTGYDMFKSETIEKTWGKGFCTIEPLTAETVSYATRYTHKKACKEKSNKGVKEFQRQSQKIGLDYWNIYKNDIKSDTGIWLKKQDKAKLVKIPRYFKKLWQIEEPVTYELYIEYTTMKQEQQEKEILSKTDKTKIEYLKTQVETSKIIYNMLKRHNLDTDSQNKAINDNIKETIKKRLTS